MCVVYAAPHLPAEVTASVGDDVNITCEYSSEDGHASWFVKLCYVI